MEDYRPFLKGRSRFSGTLWGLIGNNLLFNLIVIFSLGIALPWAYTKRYRWYIEHTTYDGNNLKFDGKGGQLFKLYVKWYFLGIFTLGIWFLILPIKIYQWKTKHTSFVNVRKISESKFTGRFWGLFGTQLLCNLLFLVTLGLAYPTTIAIMQKWESKHTIIDGYNLEFTGSGGSLIGKYIIWMLLTIITLGIYYFWIPIKFEAWKVEHTTVNDPLVTVYNDSVFVKELPIVEKPKTRVETKKIDYFEVRDRSELIKELLVSAQRKFAKKEVDEGMEKIDKALKIGSLTAYRVLGGYYESEGKTDKALETYLNGYKANSGQCAYRISYMYLNGYGVTKSNKEAKFWKAKALELNDLNALRDMGYEKIKEKDYKTAIEYLEKASELGDYKSSLVLGKIYFSNAKQHLLSEKAFLKAKQDAIFAKDKKEIVQTLGDLYLTMYQNNRTQEEYAIRALYYLVLAEKNKSKTALTSINALGKEIKISASLLEKIDKMPEPIYPVEIIE